MNVLIMCQGQQRRLPMLSGPKHLLPVNGEPIVRRTLRILRDLVDGPIHVIASPTGDQRWFDATADMAALVSGLLDPGICVVDGMLAARRRWNDSGRTLVLLGDVVWSRAALAAVVADSRPVVFAGTPVITAAEGEMFSVVFDDSTAMEKLCTTCPCRMSGNRLRGYRQQQGGHLRRLLWHAQDRAGLRVPTSLKRTWHESIYLPIEDWTDDVDTPADVARLPELGRFAELEALEMGRAARA
jgi:molybdopterin-guanine dinucleotide biosynthesis protein A